jgi:GNAT superfamily N-acetyltransferase
MPELTIRPALVVDAGEIAQVQHESWIQAYRKLLPRDFPLRSEGERVAIWQERISAHPCHTLLAEQDGALVGFLYWIPEAPHRALLRSLYLHPFFWRQGIGSQLLVQVLDDLQRDDIRRLSLWVLANNIAAERFYLHHGFHYDGQSQSQPLGSGTYLQRHMIKTL